MCSLVVCVELNKFKLCDNDRVMPGVVTVTCIDRIHEINKHITPHSHTSSPLPPLSCIPAHMIPLYHLRAFLSTNWCQKFFLLKRYIHKEFGRRYLSTPGPQIRPGGRKASFQGPLQFISYLIIVLMSDCLSIRCMIYLCLRSCRHSQSVIVMKEIVLCVHSGIYCYLQIYRISSTQCKCLDLEYLRNRKSMT